MDEVTVYLDTLQYQTLTGLIDIVSQDVSYNTEIVFQLIEMLQKIYVAQLFVIGAVGAIIVCFILYKFLKAFY